MVAALKWAAMAFFFGLWSTVNGELSCKDMDGKDVDWYNLALLVLKFFQFRFVALKIPKLPEEMNKVHPDISQGIAFYYGDSNNPVISIYTFVQSSNLF
jgi:hypothetical protein